MATRAAHTPTTGYYVEVDVCGDADNRAVVHALRRELNPQNLHVAVLTLEDDNGNVNVRISTPSNRSTLRAWLDAHGYEDEPVINARTPTAIPRHGR